MTPLLGFTPDVEITTPGAMVACSQMIPSQKGMKGAPSNLVTLYPALAEEVQGAALCTKLDGSVRFIVGANATLKEGVAGAWNDVSRVGGYLASANRWRFTQFGNDTIAANKTAFLQRSTGAAFANLTAPKMALVETVSGFVIGADCDDTGAGLGTAFGDQPNRWWCCGINDVTLWTPNLSSQATSGLLVDAPGSIRGLRRLGPNCIAYKDTAIFVGSYVGPQAGVWAWNLVPGEIGCVSHEAVVNIGTAHLFPGPEDFYMFDGTRPVPIGSPIRQWFFARLNRKYAYRMAGMHDRVNGVVWWFYPSTASAAGALDSAIVYNYRSQRWGVADRAIEVPVEVVQDGITYDGLGTLFATYDGLPAIAYDSPFWLSSTPVPAVIGTDHRPYTLAGPTAVWSFTTGLIGDDQAVSMVTRVNPRWVVKPSVAVLANGYTMSEGDRVTEGVSVTMGAAGRFDLLRAARWHQFQVAGLGDGEIVGLSIDAQPAGFE